MGSCELFSDFVIAATKMAKKDPEFAMCHMTPQVCYLRHVDYAVVMTKDLQKSLRLLHPNMANMELRAENGERECKKQCVKNPSRCISTDCLTPQAMQAAREFYSSDFLVIDEIIRDMAATGKRAYKVTGRWGIAKITHQNITCSKLGQTKMLLPLKPCPVTLREPKTTTGQSRIKGRTPLAEDRSCVSTLDECVHLVGEDASCSGMFNY